MANVLVYVYVCAESGWGAKQKQCELDSADLQALSHAQTSTDK